MIIVEAFRNIGGLSYVSNYSEFHDFNLRKYQTTLLTPASTAVTAEGEKKENDA